MPTAGAAVQIPSTISPMGPWAAGHYRGRRQSESGPTLGSLSPAAFLSRLQGYLSTDTGTSRDALSDPLETVAQRQLFDLQCAKYRSQRRNYVNISVVTGSVLFEDHSLGTAFKAKKINKMPSEIRHGARLAVRSRAGAFPGVGRNCRYLAPARAGRGSAAGRRFLRARDRRRCAARCHG